MESLLLSCRDLASPTTCRFIPAHGCPRVSPDAIHLACAASRNINLFITNDKRLLGKNIPGIDFIASLETAPL